MAQRMAEPTATIVTWMQTRVDLLATGMRLGGKYVAMEEQTLPTMRSKLGAQKLRPEVAAALAQVLESSVMSPESITELVSIVLDRTFREAAPDSAVPKLDKYQIHEYLQHYVLDEEWVWISNHLAVQFQAQPRPILGVIVRAMIRCGWYRVAETAWTRNILSLLQAVDLLAECAELCTYKDILQKIHKNVVKSVQVDEDELIFVYPEKPADLPEPWLSRSQVSGPLGQFPGDPVRLAFLQQTNGSRKTHWTNRNPGTVTDLVLAQPQGTRNLPAPSSDQPWQLQVQDLTQQVAFLKRQLQLQAVHGERAQGDIPIVTFPENLPRGRLGGGSVAIINDVGRSQPGVGPAAQPPGTSDAASAGTIEQLGKRAQPTAVLGLSNLVRSSRELLRGEQVPEEEEEEEDDEEVGEGKEELAEDEEGEKRKRPRTKATAKPKTKATPKKTPMKTQAKPKPSATPRKVKKVKKSGRTLKTSDLVFRGTAAKSFPLLAGEATVYLDPGRKQWRVKPGVGRIDYAHICYGSDAREAWQKVVLEIKKANREAGPSSG